MCGINGRSGLSQIDLKKGEKQQGQRGGEEKELTAGFGVNMDCYSDVGDTAKVFASFFIVFASLPGVQCHEPDPGSEVGSSAAHLPSFKVS